MPRCSIQVKQAFVYIVDICIPKIVMQQCGMCLDEIAPGKHLKNQATHTHVYFWFLYTPATISVSVYS